MSNHCAGCVGIVSDNPPNIVGPVRDCPGVPLDETRRALQEEIRGLNKAINSLRAERDRSNAACKSMANEILRLNNKLDKDSQHFELECCKVDRDSFRAQLGKVTAERDAAREALKQGTDRLLPFEKECYALRDQLSTARDAATQAEQDYQRCREALKISDAALEEFRTEYRAHLYERDALRADLRACVEALHDASAHLDYCNYGDSWECECAVAEGLPEKIATALARPGVQAVLQDSPTK